MSKVLITGGAGFIGRHLCAALIARGHEVRVLDILERPGHQSDEPVGLPREVDFRRGDIRDLAAVVRALDDIEIVFHLAATGGFTDRITEYITCNTIGTAVLLEAIRDGAGRVGRVVVASSVAVYGEGMAHCPVHGRVHPGARTLDRLDAGDFEPTCPDCGKTTTSISTEENSPLSPERPYSITKFDQERLVLSVAPEFGVDTAALRYFVTYGPGQSLTNPYTGVISIFANRIATGQPAILYEDGRQTRDFVYVQDVVSAHLCLLDEPRLGQRVFNVASGYPTTLEEVARTVARVLGSTREPVIPGRYRLGDIRHIHADIRRLRLLGWSPQVSLEDGIRNFVAWFQTQKPLPLNEVSLSSRLIRGSTGGVSA